MDYEVVIFTCPKDYNKCKFTIQSLKYLNPQPNKIHIVSPNTGIKTYLRNINIKNISFHNDNDVLNLDMNVAKYRRMWMWQQFAKLFNNLSNTDYYFVVDSDVVFLGNIFVFNQDKPQFFLTQDQHHVPYFNTMKKIWGLDRAYDHSFIADFMLMNKGVNAEILGKFSINELWGRVHSLINQDPDKYSFSEFETYGQFVYHHHKNMYGICKIEHILQASYDKWWDEDIERFIAAVNKNEVDAISFHTWIR